MNQNLILKIYICFILFVIVQRIVETYKLPRRDKGNIHHSWSLTVMTILHLCVVFGSASEFYFLSLKHGIYMPIVIFGVILYALAIAIRNWSKHTLSQQWSLQIEIQKDHHVVRSGPFRFVRHAAYLAIMMEVVGIPLASNAFLTLIFGSVPYIFFIVWRAAVEEKALIGATGWEYIKFQRETGAFLPIRLGLTCYDRRSEVQIPEDQIDRRKGERRRQKLPVTVDKRKMIRTKN